MPCQVYIHNVDAQQNRAALAIQFFFVPQEENSPIFIILWFLYKVCVIMFSITFNFQS
jgi:hypothetical protein